MDYWEAKINQLVAEQTSQSGEKQKTFVRSFTTKPGQDLVKKVGKVFGLIEIRSNQPQITELIDLIVEEIKNNYYHPEQPRKDEALAVSDHFEAALKKTNLTIASFLESEHISLDLEKINIIIALIHNQELHLAVVGNVGAFLFYNLSRDNYRIINILETGQSLLGPPDPLKLFSQIISGKVKKGDILFITTANVLDYFSLEKIKSIITGQSPGEGIEEFKQLLNEANSQESFAALITELEKTTALVRKEINVQEFDYHQAANKDSMKELVKTERNTERLLTPSLLPEIKKYSKSLKTGFENYLGKIKTSTNTLYQKQKNIIPSSINFKPRVKLKPKIQKFSKVIDYLKKIIQLILLGIKKVFKLIFNQPLWGKLSLIGKRLFGNLSAKFKTLPRSSKIFLVFAIILAILFSQSLIWLGVKNRQEKKLEHFNQTVVEAETKKNDATASLIYRDEGKARELLVEAKNLLVDLETSSKAQEEQVKIITAEIENELQQLRHIVEITEPVQIVNFSNLDDQASIANLALLNRRTLYTQNYNNQSIYKANLDTRVMSAVYLPDINTGNLIFGTLINDNIIFFNNSKSAFQFNPANDTLQNITISINDNADIVDATSYNGRLYLLDRAGSQIYRYSKITNGYGNVRDWIQQEGLSLSDAKSLVIDGSVYILKNNGQILKLENGQTVDFEISLIDPVLQSPIKIKTTENSNYLYILDPPTKRLVVLGKDGNLIQQYTSESFNNLKDFIIDETRKEIYILAGSSVFGIPAEHLE